MAAAMNNRFQCVTCGGQYFDHCPDGSIYHHECGVRYVANAFAVIPYDNPRNENPAANKSGAITGIVSEGAGVKCLSNPALSEPAWITVLKTRVARDAEE
jgi:hypothetical protein